MKSINVLPVDTYSVRTGRYLVSLSFVSNLIFFSFFGTVFRLCRRELESVLPVCKSRIFGKRQTHLHRHNEEVCFCSFKCDFQVLQFAPNLSRKRVDTCKKPHLGDDAFNFARCNFQMFAKKKNCLQKNGFERRWNFFVDVRLSTGRSWTILFSSTLK